MIKKTEQRTKLTSNSLEVVLVVTVLYHFLFHLFECKMALASRVGCETPVAVAVLAARTMFGGGCGSPVAVAVLAARTMFDGCGSPVAVAVLAARPLLVRCGSPVAVAVLAARPIFGRGL